MSKIGLPKGLIRYASEDEIQRNSPFKFTARMKGYTAVLGVLIVVLGVMLALRNAVEANVLRLPGQLYQRGEDGSISNVFTYKLINKTSEAIDSLNFKVLSADAEIKMVGQEQFRIEAGTLSEGTLFIKIDEAQLNSDKTKLKIGVFSGVNQIETTTTQFLAPKSFY